MKRFIKLVFTFILLVSTNMLVGVGQEVVSQKSISNDACGPCAIINALNSSSLRLDLSSIGGETLVEKAQSIIDDYGPKESVTYDDRTRFSEDTHGMAPEDMVQTMSELGEIVGGGVEFEGAYLNRREGEYLLGHLKRIHNLYKNSIERGVPVVTSIRSFVAREDQEKEKNFWYGEGNHYVVVTSVQDELRENEKGFSFEYLDSNSGLKEYGYIHMDQQRNFSAIRGNSKHFEWIKNRPFLCVVAPSLNLKTANTKFFERTNIVLSFGIFSKSVTTEEESKFYSTKMEVSCGQCQLDQEGGGCDIAVRYEGETWFVDGAGIDDFGDAHADDGFCNCIRHGLVTGRKTENGRLEVEKIHLLPIESNESNK